jgi:hypothetical protein
MHTPFIVYNLTTTRRLDRHPRTRTKLESFATIAAARAALTRECNAKTGLRKEDFGIAESHRFYKEIEKKEVVSNLMSGKPVTQGVNTPLCCDPSSETYWSM